jgi:hypothetical protein
MSRQLVLVHGREQQGKNSLELKADWIRALQEGLDKTGLKLPIPEQDIRFPYYGDTLQQLVDGLAPDAAAEVVIRGTDGDEARRRFAAAVLEQVKQKLGITDQEIEALAGTEIVEKGILNWKWVQNLLRAIDRRVGGGSGAAVALFTNDVYQYLHNAAIRQVIETGVTRALSKGVETVVVGHSLGTIVTYNLLRQKGQKEGWKVPLFVTVGSPLAVTEIKQSLRAFGTIRCPECVARWFNAMDSRDVVSLFPLDVNSFPLAPPDPSILNKTDVDNGTDNRHGISGYLNDAEVARRIHEALSA